MERATLDMKDTVNTFTWVELLLDVPEILYVFRRQILQK